MAQGLLGRALEMSSVLRSPIFRRSWLASALLVIAASGAAGAFAWFRLEERLLRAREASLRAQLSLLEPSVREDLAAGRDLGLRASELARITGARVTVIDEGGAVLADSAGRTGENYRLRPEFVAASSRGEGASVRPSPDGEDTLFFAMRIRTDAHVVYARLGVPLDDLRREAGLLAGGIGAMTGLLLLVSAGFAYRLARRHAAPLAELTRVAETIAAGRLDERSHVPEQEDISRALNTMAESLAGLVAQSARDKERLLTLLSAMEDGVVATDERQRVYLVNQAAVRLLGLPPGDLSGKQLWEMIRDDGVLRAAEAVLGGEGARPLDVVSAGGRRLRIAVTPVRSGSTPTGLLVVVQDITEAGRYEELRREFVANVSHELKTPLSSILGFVETLREGAMSDPVKGPEYLAIVERHVARLARLVDDLLALSRLESSSLPRRASVAISDLVRETVEMLRPSAERKSQELAFETSVPDAQVEGDAETLERAVRNLVDNAVKYTPDRGHIRVDVASQEGRIVIAVRDDGVGIPPEDLPRIFERFYRVDRSRSRDSGGTGLGLSIAKHAVQAHRGTIEVVSEPGRGSTFRILLPAASFPR